MKCPFLRQWASMFGLILLCLMGSMLSGCGKSPEKQVQQLVIENFEAAKQEDLDRYMETMHPESPIYENTRQSMKEMFEVYDLDYELKNVEVIERSEDKLTLKVVHITREVSDEELGDFRGRTRHVLRKHDGQWKFYKSVVEEMEFLDGGQ